MITPRVARVAEEGQGGEMSQGIVVVDVRTEATKIALDPGLPRSSGEERSGLLRPFPTEGGGGLRDRMRCHRAE
jgi:hypothetical protein